MKFIKFFNFFKRKKTLSGVALVLENKIVEKENKLVVIFSWTKNKIKKVWNKYKTLIEKITPNWVSGFYRRNLPLGLAIIFLLPTFILFFLFFNSQIKKQSTYAASFTGSVKISRLSTNLSTNGNWYTSMANSGDGVNGDAEAGTFNPIHPGGTEDGATGALAVGYITMAANTAYNAGQYIGFKPSQSGNLDGIQLILENPTTTSLSNVDIEVQLVQFPSATCTTSCSNYVTGSIGAYTFPNDTVILRKAIYQFNKGLSGENLAPGQFGRGTFDFRFDPPLAVDTSKHYGIRIINHGVAVPTFGTWAGGTPTVGFPTINGTIRSIGIMDIDLTESSNIIMPEALASGNTVLTTSGMVAANSVAGVGLPTARRTQDEHWTATYDSSNGNLTMNGNVSGAQSRTLQLTTDGSSGPSWVNDGVPFAVLTADSTASTCLCVSTISNFSANQYIHLWDSDTVTSANYTIASVVAEDSNCSNGPAIYTTANMVAGYTVSKNASVAQNTWKQRIVQGAIQSLSADANATSVVCVPDNSKFAIGGTVAIWDNDSIIISRTISSFAGSCGVGQPITLSSSPTAIYTTAQGVKIAEVSATLSASSAPSNGQVIRWTSFNYRQNPIGLDSQLARVSSVNLAYAKSEASATSNTRYPFLSNRHIYFVAYGDADTTAPADGDIVIVGNGKDNADNYDSTNLTEDLVFMDHQQHIVSIDRNWDAALAYTGNYGTAVGDGAGTRTNFATYSQNGGWVSAVVTPGSLLTIDNSAKKHYRITIPGKIVLDSDSSLGFGTPSAPLPAASMADVYFDNISLVASTNLTVNSAASATLTVASTTGFMPGDTIILDDNDSPATTRVIAAVESGTAITLTANAVTGYDIAQSAFIAKSPTTELPTGSDRRAGAYTMTGLITATQNNYQTGRVNLFSAGSDSFRTMKSNLAVDIEGDVDTGFLGNNLTDSGGTWLDVKDNVVGNWQPLDKITVGGGNNQATGNAISTIDMAANDDANQFPVWTGLNALGRNAIPGLNAETAEIGTIPMTNIYNYNATGSAFSANYATIKDWTIFGDGANTENNDAVYFGDQGGNMFYALEMNLGTLASTTGINFVWEYYNGTAWTSFTPRDAYKYQERTGYSIPLSANTIATSLTVSVASSGGSNFGIDQIVKIVDNDSPAIYRRISAVDEFKNLKPLFLKFPER